MKKKKTIYSKFVHCESWMTVLYQAFAFYAAIFIYVFHWYYKYTNIWMSFSVINNYLSIYISRLRGFYLTYRLFEYFCLHINKYLSLVPYKSISRMGKSYWSYSKLKGFTQKNTLHIQLNDDAQKIQLKSTFQFN